jgi:hypothetical protein
MYKYKTLFLFLIILGACTTENEKIITSSTYYEKKEKTINPTPFIRVKELKNRDLFEEFKFTKLDYDTAFATITNDTLKVINVFFSLGYCKRTFNPSYTLNKEIIQIKSNELFDGEIEIIGQDTFRIESGCDLATLMEFEYTLHLFGIEPPSQLYFNGKEIQINK